MGGAFETQYQTAPLDLELDIFYNSRKALINKRLEEIKEGKGKEIASRIDEIHRESKTFFVGAQWDNFSREDILEILECLPTSALQEICLQQAQGFSATGGGVPDLIIWNPETKEARFVEVKSPSDKLSETQKLWIHALREAGTIVEVCHVETINDRQKRLKKGKQKKPRSPSVETISPKTRDISVVVGSEDEVWADFDIIDIDWFEEPVTSSRKRLHEDDKVLLQGEAKRRKASMSTSY